MANDKINKNMIPEGFSCVLAWVDAVPVIFFGLTAVMLGKIMNSSLLYIGAAVCTISGLLKVLWKFIVALKHKNIWSLFLQMRIAMPIGFVMMVVGFIIDKSTENMATLSKLIAMPSLLFLIAGCIGMTAMIVFAAKLDSSDPKSNWLEQGVNGLAQVAFFTAMLLIV